MAYTRLHVVFAGRGDSLILEYTERVAPNTNNLDVRSVLSLIDGGPFYRKAFQALTSGIKPVKNTVLTDVTARETAAPYYKHLNAALREIWGQEDPLKIRTILNTHPDDDHYGGLIHLLQQNTDLAHFELDGNFLTPYWASNSSYKQIIVALDSVGYFPKTANANSLDNTRLEVYYPSGLNRMKSIAELNKKNTNPRTLSATARKALFDANFGIEVAHGAKDKNDGSIIGMVTDANCQDQNKDAILFTGDGSADRIATVIQKRVEQLGPYQGVPQRYKVPIYKIQHHGGYLKQHDDWLVSYDWPDSVGFEAMLYNIVRYISKEGLPGGIRFTHDDVANIDEYVDYFANNCLPVSPETGQAVDMVYLWTKLVERRRKYITAAMIAPARQQTVFIDATPQDKLDGQQILLAFQTIANATAQVINQFPRQTAFMAARGRPIDHVYTPVLLANGRVRKNRPSEWIEKFLITPLKTGFGFLHLIGQIQQFYGDFEADIYVVSGSAEEHQHPTPSVLLGLAEAVARQQRQAVLFLTDPGTLFSVELISLCDFCGVTRDKMFAGNHLTVRYLVNKFYMTLDASVSANPLLANRDIFQRTRQIVKFTNDQGRAIAPGTVTGPAANLERAASVIPRFDSRNLSGSRWVFAALDANRGWWYLKLTLKKTASNELFLRKQMIQLQNPTTSLGGCMLYVRESHDVELGHFFVDVSLNQNFGLHVKLFMERAEDSNSVNYNVYIYDENMEPKMIARAGNQVRLVSSTSNTELATVYVGRGRMAPFVAPAVLMRKMQTVHMKPTSPIVAPMIVPDVETTQLMDDDSGNITNEQDATSSDVVPALPEEQVGADEAMVHHVPSARVPDIANKGIIVDGAAKGYIDPFNGRIVSECSDDSEKISQADLDGDGSDADVDPGPEFPDNHEEALAQGLVVLKSYLNYNGFSSSMVTTGTQAVLALLGTTNEDGLKAISDVGLFSTLLGGAVDLDKSMITYDTTDLKTSNFDFSKVSLAMGPPLGGVASKIQLNNESFTIQSSSLILTRSNVSLEVAAEVQASNGLSLSLTQTISTPLRSKEPTLRTYFRKNGFDVATIDSITIAALFTYLLGSRDRAVRLLSDSLPAVIFKAIEPVVERTPDLDRSNLEVTASPFERQQLLSAQIVPKGLTEVTNFAVDLGIVKLTLTNVLFELRDLRSPKYSFSLTATATIAPKTAPSTGSKAAELQLRFDLLNQLSQISLEVSHLKSEATLKSINDLPAYLNVDSNALGQLSVPMTKASAPSATGSNNKSLSTLDSSAVGFTIREVNKGSDKFELSSIFVVVNFSDWQDWLPSSLTSSNNHNLISDIASRVTVLDPTEAAMHRAEVEIKFTINLPDRQNKPIAARLLAMPLLETAALKSAPDGYDFRLSLASAVGVSTDDVLTAVGLDVGPVLSGSVPLFASLVKKVKVTQVSLGIAYSSTKTPTTSFSDWCVSLRIEEPIVLLDQKFTLTSLTTTVARVQGDVNLNFEGRGRFLLGGSLNKVFDVDVIVPQLHMPGSVSTYTQDGLSLAELFKCVDIDLSGIPIIKDWVDVSLTFFSICFGYVDSTNIDSSGEKNQKPPENPSLALWTAHAEFQKVELSVAGFVFSNLAFEFTWRNVHDLFAFGTSTLEYAARATLPGNTLSARLSYSTQTSLLQVELLPLTSGNTISSLLEKCGVSTEIVGVIDPIIGQLALQGAHLVINLQTNKVDEFKVELSAAATLTLQTDIQAAPVSVRELSFEYRKGQPPAEPSSSNSGPNPAVSSPDPAPKGDNIDPTRDTLTIKGTVALGGLRTSIAFIYSSATKSSPGQLAVSIGSVDTGALSLENFAKVFGLTKPSPEVPQKASDFSTVQVTKAEGVVTAIGGASSGGNTPSSSGFSLSSLSVVVESKHPLPILSDPPVSLDSLYLQADYVRNTTPPDTNQPTGGPKPFTSAFTLKTFIYGSITIGSQLIRVAYRKDNTHSPNDSVFIGSWSPATSAGANFRPLDFKDITSRLLVKKVTTGSQETLQPAFDNLYPGSNNGSAVTPNPSGQEPKANTGDLDSLSLPSQIPIVEALFIFKPDSFFQASARGTNVWSGNFGDLSFNVAELGGYLRVATPSSPQTSEPKPAYNVTLHLYGKLTIGDFTSATATLNISPASPVVDTKAQPVPQTKAPKRLLTAQITRNANTSGDIGGLTSKLTTQSSSSPSPSTSQGGQTEKTWSQLTQDSTPLTITAQAELAIDFTAKSLFLLGQVDNKGTGLLLAGRHTVPKASAATTQSTETWGLVFALAVDNLDAVWPQLKDAVSGAFSFRRIAVQILTYETTPTALKEEITQALLSVKQSMQLEPAFYLLEGQTSGAPTGNVGQTPSSGGDSQDDKKEVEALSGPLTFGSIASKKLNPSAWFLAEIIIDSSNPAPKPAPSTDKVPISSTLALALKDSSAPSNSILLYAGVDALSKTSSTSVSTRKFGLAVQNLPLAGGIATITNGSGDYEYTFTPSSNGTAASSKTTISINARVTLLPSALSSNGMEFQVQLDINPDITSFKIAADATGPTLSQPFTEMFNVDLVNLQFGGIFTPSSKKYTLSGTVRLGGSGNDEKFVTGAVLFDSFAPRGVLLTYTTGSSLSVSDFTDKYLSGTSSKPSWPSSYPSFALNSATVAYISGDQKFQSTEPGYYLSANVILFEKDFRFSMNVALSRNAGVKFTAMYGAPIDLEILTLGGFVQQDNKQDTGPSVSVDTTSSSSGGSVIEIKAGVTFFGSTSPMNLQLKYLTNKKALSGTLTLPRDFLGIPSPPSLTILYQNGHVSFDGLGLANAFEGIAKLEKLIEDGSKAVNSDCGPLEAANFVLDNSVSAGFKFELALPDPPENQQSSITDDNKDSITGKLKTLIQNGRIKIAIKWRYDISLADVLKVSIPFQKIDIDIDPHPTEGSLIKTLEKHVNDIVPQLAKQLFSDPETVTKLTAIFALKQCAKEILSSLLCRKSEDERLPEEGEQKVEEESEKVDKDAEKANQDADDAVDTAGSGSSPGGGSGGGGGGGIGAAFDLFLTALEIAGGIAGGLGSLGTLAGHVADTDKSRADKVKAASEKARKAHEALMKKLVEARAKLQKAIVITTAPGLHFSTDDPSSATVTADWSDFVPPILNSTPEKPVNVTWTAQFSSDSSFPDTAATITAANPTSTSVSHTDTQSWPFTDFVFCRVCAIVTATKVDADTSKPGVLTGNWSDIANTSHQPFLHVPTTVSFSVDSSSAEMATIAATSTASQVVVEVRLPSSQAGQPGVTLFSQRISNSSSNVFTERNIRLQLSSQQPNIASLASVIQNGQATATAYARSISVDTKHKDSDWTASNASLTVAIGPDPSSLKIAMDGPKISASWTTPAGAKSPAASPLVYIINKDAWSTSAISSTNNTVSTTTVQLNTPSTIENNAHVIIAICNQTISTGGLPVFSTASVMVDFLPEVMLDSKASYLDLASKQLLLSTTCTFVPLASSTVLVQFTTTGKVVKLAPVLPIQWTAVAATSEHKTHAVTTMLAIANTKPPITSTVQIFITDTATSTNKASAPPWEVSITKPNFPSLVLSANVTPLSPQQPTGLIISWLPFSATASSSSAHVHVQVDGSGPTQDISPPNTSATFTTAQLGTSKSLTPGTSFTVTAQPIASQIRGEIVKLEYKVPTSEAVIASTDRRTVLSGVGFNSTTVASVLSDQVWTAWAVSSEKILGVDADLSSSGTLSLISIQGSTAIATGSSFARVLTTATREDLFYVDTSNAIQSQRWAPASTAGNTSRQFVPVANFPFNAPNTARTSGGASLTALSRTSSNSDSPKIDLWWTDPQNRLRHATYTATADNPEGASESWSDSDFFVSGDEMGPSSGTALAACQSSPHATDVLWITTSGRVQGVWHNETNTIKRDDGHQGLLYIIGENAAPGPGLAVLVFAGGAQSSSTRTWVWWIGAAGAVVMAARHQQAEADSWDTSLVAGPGSASTKSQIAAAVRSLPASSAGGTPQTEVRVWWAGTQGNVVAARMTSGVDEVMPQWTCSEALSAGTVSSSGGAISGLSAVTVGSVIQLCYVGVDGHVASIRYP